MSKAGNMVSKKYDVAILGLWYGLNYGSLLTYYALRRQIRSAGKSVVMVKYLPDNPPASINEEQVPTAHNNRFIAAQSYETHTVNPNSARSVNELADTFVIGSDQVWNYPIAKLYDGFFFMSEIDLDKRKIANAVSFGHAVDFAPDEERPRIANLMRRFNAISVREDTAVEILRNKYGVSSEWCADPLLTIDKNEILTLSKDVRIDTNQRKYILAYILDPSEEKISGVVNLAEKLGLDVKVVLDGFSHNRESNISTLGILANKLQNDVGVEEFVSLFEHSSYVVTDSFHGTVMAIKMEKDFAVVTAARMHRGMARINSLLRMTGLRARHTYDSGVIATKKRFVTEIDYRLVNRSVDRVANLSLLWLRTALDIPVNMKIDTSPIILEDDDLHDIIIGKKHWNFGLVGKEPYTAEVRFLPNGTISGISSNNEVYWEINNSNVVISDINRNITHAFMLISLDFGKPILHSDTMFDHSLVHYLN